MSYELKKSIAFNIQNPGFSLMENSGFFILSCNGLQKK